MKKLSMFPAILLSASIFTLSAPIYADSVQNVNETTVQQVEDKLSTTNVSVGNEGTLIKEKARDKVRDKID